MILELQNQIVARLKEALPGVKVEPFPDRPEAAQMTGAKGSVFVRYLGTQYRNPEELGPTPDPAEYPSGAEVRLDLIIAAQGLTGNAGALALLEAVVVALAGWRPNGFLELRPEFDELFGREGNLWLYRAQFFVDQR